MTDRLAGTDHLADAIEVMSLEWWRGKPGRTVDLSVGRHIAAGLRERGYCAPIDSDPVDRPGQVEGDQQWPERTP